MATRYDFYPCDGESGQCRAEMVEHELGDYVSTDDYNDAIRERDELRAKVERLKALCREAVHAALCSGNQDLAIRLRAEGGSK